eukprot:scaffold3002_cov64-Attheya_sp.AAC.8
MPTEAAHLSMERVDKKPASVGLSRRRFELSKGSGRSAVNLVDEKSASVGVFTAEFRVNGDEKSASVGAIAAAIHVNVDEKSASAGAFAAAFSVKWRIEQTEASQSSLGWYSGELKSVDEKSASVGVFVVEFRVKLQIRSIEAAQSSLKWYSRKRKIGDKKSASVGAISAVIRVANQTTEASQSSLEWILKETKKCRREVGLCWSVRGSVSSKVRTVGCPWLFCDESVMIRWRIRQTEASQSLLGCGDEKSASIGAFAEAVRVANQINRSCTIVSEVVLKKTQNIYSLVFVFIFRAVETISRLLMERARRRFKLSKGSDMSAVSLWVDEKSASVGAFAAAFRALQVYPSKLFITTSSCGLRLLAVMPVSSRVMRALCAHQHAHAPHMTGDVQTCHL